MAKPPAAAFTKSQARPWTDQIDARLRHRWERGGAGRQIKVLAKEFGRPEQHIIARLVDLKIVANEVEACRVGYAKLRAAWTRDDEILLHRRWLDTEMSAAEIGNEMSRSYGEVIAQLVKIHLFASEIDAAVASAAREQSRGIKPPTEGESKIVKHPQGQTCPEGHLLRLRRGPYSHFWGCSNFPSCRFTKKLTDEESAAFVVG